LGVDIVDNDTLGTGRSFARLTSSVVVVWPFISLHWLRVRERISFKLELWRKDPSTAPLHFRFMMPPSGTTCLSTSHLRRHSRFSDNDSGPFCFPVPY